MIKHLKEYWIIKKSGLFDPIFYLTRYPDVRQADVDPLFHYVKFGWKEGRNPSANFDTQYYLNNNNDVKTSAKNPLSHYALFGQGEGRKPVPIKANIKSPESNIYQKQYEISLNGTALSSSLEFVPFLKHNEIKNLETKLIAFYLPQYHPIPENDEWWGKGFTEWTNVSKAQPQFLGHYQPHLPGELGFYDLRIPEIQERQVELAKNYGIYGFCFYYYWFSGKRLLERPLDQFIENDKIDFPFCLCWANENWTRRWDGLENEILIQQQHSPENDYAFIEDLEKYLTHKNYLRINDGLVLIIYRANLFPDIAKTLKIWRNYAFEKGWGKLHLIAAQTFDLYKDPRTIGFDAAVEFPPHHNPKFEISTINNQLSLLNQNYQGNVYNYNDLMLSCYNNSIASKFPLYKTIMPSWDNEARKPGKSSVLINSSPEHYSKWLEDALLYTKINQKENTNFIFVNAWNEWAEGDHLEPDRKYGYAYLEKTYQTLNYASKNEISIPLLENKSKTAVVLHLFYPELWEEISGYLMNIESEFDLFITVPFEKKFDINVAKEKFPNVYEFKVPNRGRDILSFLKILAILIQNDYKSALKIHSKMSGHRDDGNNWRRNILDNLIGSTNNIKVAIQTIEKGNIGLLGPSQHVLYSGNYWGVGVWAESNRKHIEKLAKLLNIVNEDFNFVAGSMFWFNPKCFINLIQANMNDYDFEPETGQTDGAMAHAMERFFGLLAVANGYEIAEIDQDAHILTPDKLFTKNRLNFLFARPSKDGIVLERNP